MRQPGVTGAQRRARRERPWVDFGVDERWETAPPRRLRVVSDVDGRGEADPYVAGSAAMERELEPVAAQKPRSRRVADGGTLAPEVRPAPRRAERRAPALEDRAVPGLEDHARLAFDDHARLAFDDHAPLASQDHAAFADELTSGVQVAAREDEIPPGERRTVTIRGRGAERDLAFPAYRGGRRPVTPPHYRPGFKPDRTALWAVVLGVLLVLVAATSAHAAALGRASAARYARASAPAPLVRVVSAAPGVRGRLTR